MTSATTALSIAWQRDVDTALERARTAHRPILLDFTAAPA